VPLTVTAEASSNEEASGVSSTPIIKSFALNTRKQGSAYVDTHVHITIDGAKGEVFTVMWVGNTSSAPPPHRPAAFNYTRLKGTRCDVGTCAASLSHGSGSPSGQEKTAAECTARCDKDDTCSCVVYDSQTGACDKLARCLVDRAPRPSSPTAAFDTYVKEYTVLPVRSRNTHRKIQMGPATSYLQIQQLHYCNCNCERCLTETIVRAVHRALTATKVCPVVAFVDSV